MEIISIILNFVLGSGIVGMLIFYSSKRRKAAAEATVAEIGSVREQHAIEREGIAFLSCQLQEAWSEVEKLQNIINTKRDQIIDLIRQTKQLEIDLIEQNASRRRAEITACARDNCDLRIKPTDDGSAIRS